MLEVEWLTPWSRPEGAARTQELFQAQFGMAPDGVWSAPGRINLIGDHTDYAGGLCLPTALPHRTYIALKRRNDNEIHLYSGQASGDPVWQADISEVKPGIAGWGAYVAGVAKSLLDAGYRPKDGALGFDAAINSCIPVGAALSSSAALETSVAVALSDVWDLGLADNDEGRTVLVQICQKAENEIVGVPCGQLDQSATLLAGASKAVKLDFRPGVPQSDFATRVPFDLDSAGLAVLVMDSRAPHNLGDGQYAARREECVRAAATLGVRSLRDIGLEQLPQVLADLKPRDPFGRLRRRVRHVVTENARSAAFIALVSHGLGRGGAPDQETASTVGALMDASHASLRDDFEVTVPQTDLAVASARAAGAFGARMTGGGFGGSAIALVSRRDAEAIAAAVRHGFATVGFTAPAFLLAPPSQPAGRDS
jgi:galactokinase